LILVGTILIQAVLGGLRVKLDQLNTHWYYNTAAQTMAVFHAGTAQITVCLWVTLTAAVSRAWMVRGAGTVLVAPAVRSWAAATVGILFVQVIIGAVMRHGGYALAISTVPWSGPDHALLPVAWNWPAIVNFAHRMGATLVTLAFIGLTVNIFRNLAATRQFANLMAVILCILALQIFLGAEVIWSNKDAYYATAHMVTGAFLLASTWLLTLLCFRSAWWPPGAVEPVRAS
jgi:cytochrome c oxidase assembly protein subunit 15